MPKRTTEETIEENYKKIEENYKKIAGQMLILCVLARRDSYIAEVMETIEQDSGGTIQLANPYCAFQRLTQNGYITRSGLAITDGRRRQYYAITQKGKNFLKTQISVFEKYAYEIGKNVKKTKDMMDKKADFFDEKWYN